MSLGQQIADDMKAAMRAKDAPRLEAIRLLRAAIQRREVDERVTLDDTGILQVIEKLIRQGQESMAQFEGAGRTDLVVKERASLAVFTSYLPTPLAPEEVEALIDAAIRDTQAVSIKDMGKVVAYLKPRLQGRADMAAVSGRVRERLA
ncbi:MAG: GatB/YqeY domain-containing protein [Gammaproteobacteria bacterium]|nr:GatB/YqeY domain-containing protein [Gammaproteobacteria bacterium]